MASETSNPSLVFLHHLTQLPPLQQPSKTIPCDNLLCPNLRQELDSLNEASYQVNQSANFTAGDHDDGEDNVKIARWEILFLLLMVLAGVTGNLLVCVAIAVERKLQNVTNFFLMSLAIADLFVSVLVMPGSIVYEIMGYWPFGLVLCDMWQVSDVMMCTSSIMHMCTISLDRYIGIRNPLKMRNKSHRVVAIKISLVWLISFLIASPLIILAVFRPNDILTLDQQCGIFNKNFTVYGSIAAFFLPLVIMLVAYSLTIHILHKQAQQCETKLGMRRSIVRRKKQFGKGSSKFPTSDDKDEVLENVMKTCNGGSGAKAFHQRIIKFSSQGRKDVTDDGSFIKRKTINKNDMRSADLHEIEPLQSKTSELESDSKQARKRCTKNGAICTEGYAGLSALTQLKTASNIAVAVTKTASKPNQQEEKNQGDKRRFRNLITKHRATIKFASLLLAKRDDNDKKQMNNVKTERKAVKVLGTMFAIFVICWAPFFSINLAMGVCRSCNIHLLLFKIFLWLGYLSSTLNPIIYTIFNKNFKNTFIKIIKCGYWRCKCDIKCRSLSEKCCMSRNKTARCSYRSHGENNYDFYKYSAAALDNLEESKL